MDELIDQLHQLHLDRAEAARAHDRALEEYRDRERNLVREISLQRAAVAAAAQQHTHRFQLGQRVRITNTLRDEFNTEGTVTRVSRRMIHLRDDRGRNYSRAHWNLERIREPRNAQ